MSTPVTLDLPPEMAQQARAVADRTHQRLEDVLLDWLRRGWTTMPIEQLPDDQVLALRDLVMSDADQRELSDLLAAQREGTLDGAARQRLEVLMAVYRHGMARKAEALQVAVERGLQPPLDA